MLGFTLYFREQMRLAHYAAPETRGIEKPLGLIAKQKLEEILPVGIIVTITSHKTEKFGRWLAEVTVNKQILSDILIKQGYGLPWDSRPDEIKPQFDPSAPYPLKTSQE